MSSARARSARGEAALHGARMRGMETAPNHLSPDVRTLLTQAVQLAKQGNYEAALNGASAALRSSPLDRAARALRARCLCKLSRHAEALAELDRLLEQTPGHAGSLFARASCLNALGRYAEAIEDYEQALESDKLRTTAVPVLRPRSDDARQWERQPPPPGGTLGKKNYLGQGGRPPLPPLDVGPGKPDPGPLEAEPGTMHSCTGPGFRAAAAEDGPLIASWRGDSGAAVAGLQPLEEGASLGSETAPSGRASRSAAERGAEEDAELERGDGRGDEELLQTGDGTEIRALVSRILARTEAEAGGKEAEVRRESEDGADLERREDARTGRRDGAKSEEGATEPPLRSRGARGGRIAADGAAAEEEPAGALERLEQREEKKRDSWHSTASNGRAAGSEKEPAVVESPPLPPRPTRASLPPSPVRRRSSAPLDSPAGRGRAFCSPLQRVRGGSAPLSSAGRSRRSVCPALPMLSRVSLEELLQRHRKKEGDREKPEANDGSSPPRGQPPCSDARGSFAFPARRAATWSPQRVAREARSDGESGAGLGPGPRPLVEPLAEDRSLLQSRPLPRMEPLASRVCIYVQDGASGCARPAAEQRWKEGEGVREAALAALASLGNGRSQDELERKEAAEEDVFEAESQESLGREAASEGDASQNAREGSSERRDASEGSALLQEALASPCADRAAAGPARDAAASTPDPSAMAEFDFRLTPESTHVAELSDEWETDDGEEEGGGWRSEGDVAVASPPAPSPTAPVPSPPSPSPPSLSPPSPSPPSLSPLCSSPSLAPSCADPGSEEALLYARGQSLRRAGRLPEARGAYRACLALRPAHFRARFHLGLCLLREGELRPSLRAFEECCAQRPDASRPHYNRGLVLLALGRAAEAARALDAALALAPRAPAYLTARGDARLLGGDAEAALADYEAASRRQPGAARALFGAARARERLGDADGALRVYARLLAAEPAHAGARHNRGCLLLARDRPAEAAAELALALEARPDWAPAWLARGEALARLGLWEAAAEAHARAAELAGPEEGPAALRCLGRALQQAERCEEAVQVYDRLLKLGSRDLQALLGKGYCLRRRGDWNGSAREYSRALLVAGSQEPRRSRILASRAFALARGGLLEEALADYEAVLRVWPADEHAQANREVVLALLEAERERRRRDKGKEPLEAESRSPY